MFPTEADKAAESPADRDRRRAGTGVDRRGLKQVGIAMLLLFGAMVLIAAVEIVGVERRLTTATVVGLTDRWTMKRSHECVTELSTSMGDARIYTRNLCRYARWHVGDTATVEARRLRLTRTLVLRLRGTIFEGAYTMLPEW